MKPVVKAALVAGGYAACLLLAFAAEAVRVAATSGPARQAAGGMYGFGDGLLFFGVFGVSALAPTGAALYLLRPHPAFWKVLAPLGLALALTGVAAAVLFAAGRGESTGRLGALAEYSVLRILVSPLLALLFLVCAVFSPVRLPRRVLFTAAAMEAAVITSWVAVWIVPAFLRGT